MEITETKTYESKYEDLEKDNIQKDKKWEIY